MKRLLRTMLCDDDATDDFFNRLIQTGRAMYLLRIHYAVVKTLMMNPFQYAEGVIGMQHFLMQQCTGNETSTPRPYTKAKRNLASLTMTQTPPLVRPFVNKCRRSLCFSSLTANSFLHGDLGGSMLDVLCLNIY